MRKLWQLLFIGFTGFVFGLSVTRLCYELFFPRFLWLAELLPVLGVGVVSAVIFLLLSNSTKNSLFITPILLNLTTLLNPAVNVRESWIVFGVSLLAVGLLLGARSGEWGVRKESFRPSSLILHPLFLLLVVGGLYFLTIARTVGEADTFEFQVRAQNLGIVHPTGYPLYLLLGKAWTLLPLGGEVAWRLNVGTAVYALIACYLLYKVVLHLTKQPNAALFAALIFAVRPTFWASAVEAEVYTLHAMVVGGVLLVIVWSVESGKWKVESKSPTPNAQLLTPRLILPFLLGLGLTNHLTTLILAPAVVLTLLSRKWKVESGKSQSPISNIQSFSSLIPHPSSLLAFLLPLTLYAYLPIRWAATNDDQMGFSRFIDWVVGGRFQDALQLAAWYRDPSRYEVVWRLGLVEWGWGWIILAAIGLVLLLWRKPFFGFLSLMTWGGFCFYVLSYYVPDLSVFFLPAHLIMAIWIGFGLSFVFRLVTAPERSIQVLFLRKPALLAIPVTILLGLFLRETFVVMDRVDQSADSSLVHWAHYVLDLPLAENATILADSEKIAPLTYLHETEHVRPDLNIMVLPDEAAYRAELDSRISNGESVYLARFLPNLEGIYHLSSVGPLIEVSTQPNTTLADQSIDIRFDDITLLSYHIDNADNETVAPSVTFNWQANAPLTDVLHVYTRLNDVVSAGQHPANNYYPTVAWEVGEVVADYHELKRPFSSQATHALLEVALAPPFADPATLSWKTVDKVNIVGATTSDSLTPIRTNLNHAQLTGIDIPTSVRNGEPITIRASGYGNPAVSFGLGKPSWSDDYDDMVDVVGEVFFVETVIEDVPEENGRYTLYANDTNGTRCGWLRSDNHCPLGEIEISGVALPTGAQNFADKIALLDTTIDEATLQSGGLLSVSATWQSLAAIDQDYTLFIQVLDENDKIVGQLDTWPLQGTLPTSTWSIGETLDDGYLVQLDPILDAGNYRIIMGWYLLADLRRLPLLNAEGASISDHVVYPKLQIK